MIDYWSRVMWYAMRRRRTGASDEHKLFPTISLPPSPRPWTCPRLETPLDSEWTERLETTHTRAFRVIRNGVTVRSWDKSGDAPNRPGRLYSLTKSVLSLAWGIADGEGRVPSLNTPVFHGLTVRNLLRMDSGIGFDEGFQSLNRQVLTYLHPHSRKTARRGRLENPVAKEFHYNDFHSLLLGVLLEEGLSRSGWRPRGPIDEPVAAWIWERLLAPVGMENPGQFVIDSRRHRFPKTESGLCLSADDVAKIGLLVLGGGRWNGEQIVPETWLTQSLDPDQGWKGKAPFHRYQNLAWGPWLSTGRGAYGWHWWLRPEAHQAPTVFGLGVHGQLLVISPRHQAVVVRLADRWALRDWWPEVILSGLDEGRL